MVVWYDDFFVSTRCIELASYVEVPLEPESSMNN